ncbi:GD15413 [Drosophila simulans]|nr:GD15413 [Drosophila simulans]
MASNLKGNNTTNLWTHLRHKHRDEVLVSPVQQRPQARMIPIIKKDKTVRITKAKTLREPLRVAKPKIESNVASYLGEAGALPQKWEEYEQNDEISEDIKDIIYSEDPLCYSPIHVMDDEGLDQPEKQVTVLTHSTSPAGGSSRPIGVGSGVQATVVASTSSSSSSAKQLKNNLETSIERLTAVSEQLSYIIQQNHEELTKDDDYYFALSLVPVMRHLSLSRKMYVRSKIQDILFKESEDSPVAKDE